MNPITFTVEAKIRGKSRPRFARMGKFVRTYTPRESQEFEKIIALHANRYLGKPILGAVGLSVRAFFKIPVSCSKKEIQERLRGSGWHIQKIDADNLLKCVADSLNGIAFKDDAQISDVCVFKRWTTENERLEITIEEL